MEINQLKNQWDSFVDESNLREKLIEEKKEKHFGNIKKMPQFQLLSKKINIQFR